MQKIFYNLNYNRHPLHNSAVTISFLPTALGYLYYAFVFGTTWRVCMLHAENFIDMQILQRKFYVGNLRLFSSSVETVINVRTSWGIQADDVADESYQLKLCWNWIARHPSFTAAANFFVHCSVKLSELMKINGTERQFILKIVLISQAVVNWIDDTL